MLYVHKQPCPEILRKEVERMTATDRWKAFSDPPASGEPKIIREKYFRKLVQRSKDKGCDIHAALASEQHGLCAYCMCRLKDTKEHTTIEHVIPLSISKAGALDYQNWLGVCHGGRRSDIQSGQRRILCCDAKKENMIPVLTPLNRKHMDNIAYYDDGTIFYRDTADPDYQALSRDINEVYGLNGTVDAKSGRSVKDTSTGIVKQRKDAYISMFDELMQQADEGTLTAALIVRFRESLLADPDWESFLGVKLYVLDQFLERLS